MGYFDCHLTVECKHVASEWLQSADPLIQDFGARWLGSALMVDGYENPSVRAYEASRH